MTKHAPKVEWNKASSSHCLLECECGQMLSFLPDMDSIDEARRYIASQFDRHMTTILEAMWLLPSKETHV